MREWSPEYLAYCAEHGHAGDPMGMIEADKKTYPDGFMTGFWFWNRARWLEFMRARPNEMIIGGSHKKEFQAWLIVRAEEGKEDAGAEENKTER